MKKPKLLTVIIERDLADKAARSLEECGANLNEIMYGTGTARSDILNVLGLCDTQKAIILSTLTEEKIPSVFSMLTEKYNFSKPGKGIAFTVPISAVGGPATLRILTNETGGIE